MSPKRVYISADYSEADGDRGHNRCSTFLGI